MFNWIARMYNAVTGRIDSTVAGWVRDLVNGLYGFLHTVFGHVISGWDDLYAKVNSFVDGAILEGAHNIILWLHLLQHVIPSLVKFLRGKIDAVLKYADDVYRWALRTFAAVAEALADAISSLWSRVIREVWNPLKAAFDTAWHWITHEGALVYDYITHPSKLVDLIWETLLAKLETEAWAVAGKLGTFALSLVVKNLGRFVSLLEDILNAVF